MQESALAARVLEYAAAEHVGTQALLLSLFVGTCAQAARIARGVAHHILARVDFASVCTSRACLSVARNSRMLPSIIPTITTITTTITTAATPADSASRAQDPYTALPSLDPLVDALSDTRGAFEAGEATDYDELGARVAVLGVALTGVDGYVAQELARLRETRFAALEEDGGAAGGMGREPAPLELVKNRLDVLHARIGASLVALFA